MSAWYAAAADSTDAVPAGEAPPGEAPAAPAAGEVPPAEVPAGEVPPVEAPAGEAPPAEVPPSEVPPIEAPPAEAPAAAQDPKAAPANWWEGLVGKRCKVDLGRVKVLTMRDGDLKDGEVLDWKSKFGNRPAVGRLFQEQETIALVLGVATDSVGNPVAAKVTVERQGRSITGIIALHTQGLRVSLHPVE